MLAVSLLVAGALAFQGHRTHTASQPVPTPPPGISAPVTNVRYELTFDSSTAATRTVKVAMTFDVAGPQPVLLSIPT